MDRFVDSLNTEARLNDNARVLVAAYHSLADETRGDRPISPAAEWLLDNFHIVEEQIREIKEDLPPSYYRELPKLADGHLKGYPRVFGVAWAFVAHTDSRFDAHVLTRFVNAYQRVQPLNIGELWATAITLRITLVENLRRIAEGLARNRQARIDADVLADRLLGTSGKKPEPVKDKTPTPEALKWSVGMEVQSGNGMQGAVTGHEGGWVLVSWEGKPPKKTQVHNLFKKS
jgi:cyclic beta-1,2-glucan synthetase